MFRKWISLTKIKALAQRASTQPYVKNRVERFSVIHHMQHWYQRWFWYCFTSWILPWHFIYYYRHDTAMLLSMLVSVATTGSTIWIPFIIGMIFGWTSAVGISMLSIISTSIVFWNLPGTPWLLLTYGLGLGIYALYKKFTKYNINYHILMVVQRRT